MPRLKVKDLKKDKTRHRGSLSQDKTQQRDHVEHVSPSLTFPLKLEPFFFFPFLCVLGANGRRVTGVGEQGQEQGSQEHEAPWDRKLASGSSSQSSSVHTTGWESCFGVALWVKGGAR